MNLSETLQTQALPQLVPLPREALRAQALPQLVPLPREALRAQALPLLGVLPAPPHQNAHFQVPLLRTADPLFPN